MFIKGTVIEVTLSDISISSRLAFPLRRTCIWYSDLAVIYHLACFWQRSEREVCAGNSTRGE